jgi:hypothetical protein
LPVSPDSAAKKAAEINYRPSVLSILLVLLTPCQPWRFSFLTRAKINFVIAVGPAGHLPFSASHGVSILAA